MPYRVIRHTIFVSVFAFCLISLATAQTRFEDQMRPFPGMANNCAQGMVLPTSTGHWLSISHCGDSRIAITQYNSQFQLVEEYGLDGVVIFDSSEGITSHQELASQQMPLLGEFIAVTDAKLTASDELIVTGFNYDIEAFPDAPLAYQNYQSWWLRLDPQGIPVLTETGDYLHTFPNALDGFVNFGGGNWFGGLRSEGFVLPLDDGSTITGSVLLSEDAEPLRQHIYIEKRLANLALDTDFAQNGRLVFDPFNSEQLNNIAYIAGIRLLDEKHFLLIIGDFYRYRHGGFSLYKVDVNGVIDTEFGENGVISTPGLVEIAQFDNANVEGVQYASLSDLVLHDNWLYLAWQEQANGAEGIRRNVVARYDLNGHLDTTFALNGLYKWETGFSDLTEVRHGNAQLAVLDGQIALFNSDVHSPSFGSTAIQTDLRLLTHTGHLNPRFGNDGIISTTQWQASDPFLFTGNINFTPPLTLNKALHVLPQQRQLVLPVRQGFFPQAVSSNLSVFDAFSNQRPSETDTEFDFVETNDGWIIDTRIIDPDTDPVDVILLQAPDYVRVTSRSVDKVYSFSLD